MWSQQTATCLYPGPDEFSLHPSFVCLLRCCNIILPLTSVTYKESLSWSIFHHKPECVCLHFLGCQELYPSHQSLILLDMKLTVMLFSLAFLCFLPRLRRYCSQHLVFQHPLCMFIPHFVGRSLTLIQNIAFNLQTTYICICEWLLKNHS